MNKTNILQGTEPAVEGETLAARPDPFAALPVTPPHRGPTQGAPLVLEVKDVCKSFRTYRSILHRIAHWFGLSVKPVESIDVVKSLSFSVRKGESLALIGQNGAGKSTILKLITGTLAPTTGSVQAIGSVSAILELGLGFNGEFTGRENVRHSGGMMGLSPQQIEVLLPEIEAFAEIGEYFDRPFRMYSSGMQARLSFALATAARPEILIVDEVLSVGDAYFQHKSFARIREFRDNGTTIILVSHAMSDIRELCDRVILIDSGCIVRDGQPDEVIDYYNAMVTEKENAKLSLEQRRTKQGWSVTRSGDYRVVLEDMRLLDGASGNEVTVIPVGSWVKVQSRLKVLSDIRRLVVGHMIRDRTGHCVWGTNTWHTNQSLENLQEGQFVDVCFILPCNLGPGSYSITYNLVSTDTRAVDNYESQDNFLVFQVVNIGKPFFVGTTWLDASIDQKVGNSSD